ncbi:DUF4383 domain-containing protein [Streptomyces sp. NBC_00151]|uniref:DUF4383 domain-containing protein n=1 Tax=Streptomyces sp. NBC_00151 TaxID=2975669 RepID=UPI002DD7A8CD|nr:DUF4383 domain-containing protein [Streptomyces sp. NBC_00151]WRZ37012.1 DUF4383 domain-containing protein [Streptomyces sp. NBC_00151]
MLQDELPVDHHLAAVYRWGAAFCGVVLLVFGILGFADELSLFNTEGQSIAGMSTNGALSLISVLVGLALIIGGSIGGNVASTLNMAVGTLFLLSGFVHIFILDRPANILDFGMTNVIFSFVMGLVILTFGMYGRVSSKLPHDNPYWRRRHPRKAAEESLARRRQPVPAEALPTGTGRTALRGATGSPGSRPGH